MITDPGLAARSSWPRTRNARLFAGEPTIGGRYSALSPFGLVPAALMGIDVGRLLDRAEETLNACRVADDNPGPRARARARHVAGRRAATRSSSEPNRYGFGLWVEQLLAESTGKEGRGLVPAPGESPDGPDRQAREVELADPYDLGAEFYRWEFATAVAGAILEINPFDQPNVQDAKDRTNEVLAAGDVLPPRARGLGRGAPRAGAAGRLRRDPGVRRPGRGGARCRRSSSGSARQTDCVVTFGLGPRYLHSTGQLHKGGAPIGCFLQIVDDIGPRSSRSPARSSASAGSSTRRLRETTRR